MQGAQSYGMKAMKRERYEIEREISKKNKERKRDEYRQKM